MNLMPCCTYTNVLSTHDYSLCTSTEQNITLSWIYIYLFPTDIMANTASCIYLKRLYDKARVLVVRCFERLAHGSPDKANEGNMARRRPPPATVTTLMTAN